MVRSVLARALLAAVLAGCLPAGDVGVGIAFRNNSDEDFLVAMTTDTGFVEVHRLPGRQQGGGLAMSGDQGDVKITLLTPRCEELHVVSVGVPGHYLVDVDRNRKLSVSRLPADWPGDRELPRVYTCGAG